jgi:hypothetical protein
MNINLEHSGGKYIVNTDERHFEFKNGEKAVAFMGDAVEYGVRYTQAVYEKITCMKQLHLFRKGDKQQVENTRKMLLSLRSGILMDNAVRGIITRDYTLDQLLARKGFLN